MRPTTWRTNEAMATANASARACVLATAIGSFTGAAMKHQVYAWRLQGPGGVSG